MANRSSISIKDYFGNEKKVATMLGDIIEVAGDVNAQYFLQCSGMIEDLDADHRIASKRSQINQLYPVSDQGACISLSKNIVIVPKFYDYRPRSEVIGTGDGSNTFFNHTLTYRPIIPNSIEIEYTSGGGEFTAYDECQDEDPLNEMGEISGDAGGDSNYRTGELNVDCVNPPDSGTDVVANYKTFSTVAADTNIIVTPHLLYIDPNSNKRSYLKNCGQFTLSAVDWPVSFQNSDQGLFGVFAGWIPGGDYLNAEDWYWAGDVLVIENTVGANSIFISVDAFTHVASSATFSMFAFGF